ncbi:CHAT domain-containing protein [Sphingomonas sp.]|jgi:CHAT domain-containing protein/tetratricopeptide (TPR) repeat protein|uniref:CHAT domain-containing tetratricopeptide repeat protein n=1 Tax=Sphingomonas sp. TaxID=28214 RepID=UPI002D7F213F|nr:CHAT domain-containing protein [Sphingomonas sp.]HEU0043260.1 CHAT domain-containing protein [Sphingomonas sp.]
MGIVPLVAWSAVLLTAWGPVGADTPVVRPSGFNPADPAYRQLYALEAAAVALDLDQAKVAELPVHRAAWTTLRDAALATPVPGTQHPHPLAGRALVMLAAVEQMADDYPLATERVTAGLALLAPFADHYRPAIAQGRTLQGFFKVIAGDAAGGLAILEPNVADFERFHDALPPAGRTKQLEVQRADGLYAYSQALARLGKLDQAAVAQQRSAAAMAAGLGPNAGAALRAQADYAVLLGRAGRRDEAEAVARAVVERTVANLPRTDEHYPRILGFTGLMLSRNGRRLQGSAYLEGALEAMTAAGTDRTLSFHQFRQAYGSTLFERELYPQSLHAFDGALTGFRAAKSPFDIAKALSLIGLAHFAEGQSALAARELGEAVGASRARDRNTREVAQVSLPVLTVATLDAGRVQEAKGHADQFVTDVAATEGAQAFLRANAAALRAYVALRGDPAGRAAAVAAAGRMVGVVADNRLLAGAGELPQRERAGLDLALRIAVEARDPALGLKAMAVLAGSRMAQANRLLIDRLATGDPGLGSRVRALQDAVRAAQSADGAYLSALGGSGDVAERRLARDRAAGAVGALRAAIARDHPRWDEANALAAVDLPGIRAGLARGEALLGVTPAFDGVYVLAIGRSGAAIERTAIGRAGIVAAVSRLRASLPAGAFDAAAAHALHAQMFTPGVKAALGGATSLRVVATGALAALPFAALLERPVTRVDRAAPFLVRRYAMRMASGFVPVPAVRASGKAERFLGIGAPLPFPGGDTTRPVMVAGRYYRGGGTDPGALGSLPPLPAALGELRAVANRLGSSRATLLTGGDASEARVRGLNLGGYSTVMFATHGLVSGEMEGVTEPALVLSPPRASGDGDGLLGASEIATLRLDADWVILSACNTAAGDGVATPAFSGLAQAFRYAGARSLLLSHWPVRDDAAARISVDTVSGARAGLPREVALQRAMLRLLADRSVVGGADPYVWAPYVLVD